MATVQEIETQIAAAQADLDALEAPIAAGTVRLRSITREAAGNAIIRDQLELRYLQALREAETAALARLPAIRHRASELARTVSDLAVTVSDADAGRAWALTLLYPEADRMDVAKVERELRSAILRDDRGGQLYWSRVARRRLRATAPETREDIPADLRRLRHELDRLLAEANRSLRDPAGDAALVAATALCNRASALIARIERARANRGDARPITSRRKTVRISGSPPFDRSGDTELASS